VIALQSLLSMALPCRHCFGTEEIGISRCRCTRPPFQGFQFVRIFKGIRLTTTNAIPPKRSLTPNAAVKPPHPAIRTTPGPTIEERDTS